MQTCATCIVPLGWSVPFAFHVPRFFVPGRFSHAPRPVVFSVRCFFGQNMTLEWKEKELRVLLHRSRVGFTCPVSLWMGWMGFWGDGLSLAMFL